MGEIEKKKIPFEKKFGLRKFSPKKSKKRSKKKLDLENFHQTFFFFAKSLKMSCLMEKL